MKEDKVVYAMALLALLSVAGLLLFELALSPKARYPLTVTRVQQVQQPACRGHKHHGQQDADCRAQQHGHGDGLAQSLFIV